MCVIQPLLCSLHSLVLSFGTDSERIIHSDGGIAMRIRIIGAANAFPRLYNRPTASNVSPLIPTSIQNVQGYPLVGQPWAPVRLQGAAAAAPGLPEILGVGGVREMHVHHHGPKNRRGRRCQHSEQQRARAPWELGFDSTPTAVPGHDQQKAQYITYPSKR